MESRKRPADEFSRLDVASPTKCARVHGLITKLSPMKSSAGKNGYFEGQLADESTSIRLVEFDISQQHQMATLHDAKKPITLEKW